MSAALLNAAKAALAEMDAVSKAFGAPGDYGYSTKEGKALFSLCRAAVNLSNAINAEQQRAKPAKSLHGEPISLTGNASDVDLYSPDPDRGRRYEVQIEGYPRDGWNVVGWSDDENGALRMAMALRSAPGARRFRVWDRTDECYVLANDFAALTHPDNTL